MALEGGAATIAFLFALITAIVILLRRSHRYFGRRPRDQSPIAYVPRSKDGLAGRQHDATAELMREQVQMHETARELAARMDSKIRVLQQLSVQARQQIDRLEELLERAEQQAAPDDDTSRPQREPRSTDP